MYRSPTQLRAKKTEDTFLSAFRQLLSDQGFAKTSIDEIALLSGQTRSAFLSRFGTKKAALFVLFDEYCAEVSELMTNISLQIQRFDDAEACVNRMSTSLEARLIKHFASNRAMHEIYLEDLQTDERTQRIFRQLVELMRQTQEHHLSSVGYTSTGAYCAAQLLVTINYNYVLKAMPAFAREVDLRHDLISKAVVTALKF